MKEIKSGVNSPLSGDLNPMLERIQSNSFNSGIHSFSHLSQAVCTIMAFWAVVGGFGLLLYLLLRSRVQVEAQFPMCSLVAV